MESIIGGQAAGDNLRTFTACPRVTVIASAGTVDLDRLVEDPLYGSRGGDLDHLDLGVRRPLLPAGP
jgi:hypothetical protein